MTVSGQGYASRESRFHVSRGPRAGKESVMMSSVNLVSVVLSATGGALRLSDSREVPVSFEEIEKRFRSRSSGTSRSGRESYWKTRSQKLKERLAREQEIYDERQYQRGIDEELHAEHRQQEQLNERVALSELGVEPGTMGLTSPVLPLLRGTSALLTHSA